MSEREFTDKLILIELNEIVQTSPKPDRRSSRTFFQSSKLSSLLKRFMREHELTREGCATLLGMSAPSFNRIVRGEDISENMLFRMKTYFEKHVELDDTPMSEIRKRLLQDWKRTDTKEIQNAIRETALSLSQLYSIIKVSNQIGAHDYPINSIQKAQLVAMLEAMLATLKAPAIRQSETKSFFNWLGRIAKRGAEKGIEKNISGAFEDAYEKGQILASEIAKQQGFTDIDNIF